MHPTSGGGVFLFFKKKFVIRLEPRLRQLPQNLARIAPSVISIPVFASRSGERKTATTLCLYRYLTQTTIPSLPVTHTLAIYSILDLPSGILHQRPAINLRLCEEGRKEGTKEGRKGPLSQRRDFTDFFLVAAFRFVVSVRAVLRCITTIPRCCVVCWLHAAPVWIFEIFQEEAGAGEVCLSVCLSACLSACTLPY